MLLQIEVKRKMLGRSVTFGPKSVEKRFQQQNFFELTTPTTDAYHTLNQLSFYGEHNSSVDRATLFSTLVPHMINKKAKEVSYFPSSPYTAPSMM